MKKILLVLGAVIIIAVAARGFWAYQQMNKQPATMTASSTVSSNIAVDTSANYDTSHYTYGFSNHYRDPKIDREYGKEIADSLNGKQDYFVRKNISTGRIEQLYSYDELVRKIPEMTEPNKRELFPAIFGQPPRSTKIFLNFFVSEIAGIASLIYSYDVTTGTFAKLPNVSNIISSSRGGDLGGLCSEGCAYNLDKTKFVMAKDPYLKDVEKDLYLVDLMNDRVSSITKINSGESFDKNPSPNFFDIVAKWIDDHTIQYGVYKPISIEEFNKSYNYGADGVVSSVAPLIEYRRVSI